MNAAEVVEGKMQIHSSPKIFKFPREAVRQACEAAKLHSDGQVLPLHVAGWDQAIADAQELLGKVEARAARLRGAIRTFKENKAAGEPYVPQSTDHKSEAATQC